MQNVIWKFTALTGVIGIGFLVVLQVQRSLIRQRDGDAAELAANFEFPELAAAASDEMQPPEQPAEPSPDAAPVAFGQQEPESDSARTEVEASSRRESRHSRREGAPDNPFTGQPTPPSAIRRELVPLGISDGDEHDFTSSSHEKKAPAVDLVQPFGSEPDPFADSDSKPSVGSSNLPRETEATAVGQSEGNLAASQSSRPLEPKSNAPTAEGEEREAVEESDAEESEQDATAPEDGRRPRPTEFPIIDDPFGGPPAKKGFADGPQLVPPAPLGAEDDDKAETNAPEPRDESAVRFGQREEPDEDLAAPPQLGDENPFGARPESPDRGTSSESTDETQEKPGHFGRSLSTVAGKESNARRRPDEDHSARPLGNFEGEQAGSLDPVHETNTDKDSRRVGENRHSAGPSLGGKPQNNKLDLDSNVAGTVVEPPAPKSRDLQELVKERSVPKTASVADVPTPPKRLDPPPAAVRIDPITNDLLKGSGTVDKNAPRGPQRPQLHLEKVAPPNAVLGMPMVYAIVVRNEGSGPAHEVVVEDEIPKGTKLTGTIPRAELSNTRLIWRIGTLDPGQERQIKVRVVPESEGQIGSIATVNFNSEVAARTFVSAPKLELVISTPKKQCSLGDAVPFHFKLENVGSGKATGVVLRDIIPNGLKHPDGNDLEYEVGTLPPGESREVKLTLEAVRPGDVVNEAVVTADGGLTVKADSQIEVSGSYFTLSRSGPSRRAVGSDAVFINTVTNDSTRPVSGAALVEQVPIGMKFVEASNGGQYDPANRTVTWRLDKLESNQSKVLKVTLMPVALGVQKSFVRLYDPTGKVRKQATSDTEITGFASLVVSVSDVPSPLAVGEKVTYFVRVRNRGSAAAKNVSLKLGLPAQLQLVSAQGPVKYSTLNDAIRFVPIASLRSGGEEIFKLEFLATGAGDARLLIQVDDEQMERPLNREEALLVYVDKV